MSFLQVTDADDIIMMPAEGKVLRMRIGVFREIGRNLQGVRLTAMSDDDRVVGVAKLMDAGDSESPDQDLQDTNGQPSLEPEADGSGDIE